MVRAELVKQVLRLRTLVALLVITAMPIVAGVATASEAGGRNGSQSGLYGAAPFSAVNHAAASLEFTAPLLLALVVALVGSALGAADRDWGTLRYLYVRPVSRGRLLGGKWIALSVCCAIATASVLVVGLLVGLAVFGWHPFHRLDAPALSSGSALARLLLAGAYVFLCMLSIGTLAFALGLLLPGPGEALGASVAFVVIADVLDGQPSLQGFTALLPVHYWQRWTHLLDGTAAGLPAGAAVQVAAVAVVLAAALGALNRRDPAA